MGEFDYIENTAVDEVKERFSLLGMFADIIKLFLFVTIIYSVYLIGTVTYDNMKIREEITSLSELASETINDRKIRGIMKDYCLDYEKILCDPDTFKIERNFESATVSIKYKQVVKIFWKYPFTVTFEPKSTTEIYKLNL